MHYSQVKTPEQARRWLMQPVDVTHHMGAFHYKAPPAGEYERIIALSELGDEVKASGGTFRHVPPDLVPEVGNMVVRVLGWDVGSGDEPVTWVPPHA